MMNRILPAYPLWIVDPNFSVWSPNDSLNEGNAAFWTGLSRRTCGLVRFNNKTYCFLGQQDGAIPLTQMKVDITAFTTEYQFVCNEFELNVKFVSPLLPNDLKLLSCPVCFTEYEIVCDEVPEDFSVVLALDEEYCYDKEKAPVVGGVLPFEHFEAGFMTRQRNLVMSNTNDCIAADWGDVYLTGDECWFVTEAAMNRYAMEGKMEYIRRVHERNYVVGLCRSQKGVFLTGYDEKVAIFYFGEWLKSYYFEDGKTITDALQESYANYAEISEKCRVFDEKLKMDCDKVGEGFYTLACASLRQSVGAHKLVKNAKGEFLFLSKECNSNGCIGTADVSYPSMPLYLLYNPDLVNAMMTGIYDFARMPVWTYDFAPHDIGTYPWCCGQVYGVKNTDDKYSCNMTTFGAYPRTHTMLYLRPAASNVYDYDMQMPVEECGNMLIMTAAAILAGADIKQARENFDLLEKWVKYLEKFGLRPENQLCTDDFAGHLANNVNLSIKAMVGLEAFAIISDKLGKHTVKEEYDQKAKVFATQIQRMCGDGIMPLAYDMEDSYSLKYNLLFDKLFGYHLIGQDVCEQEISHYVQKNNRYGVPLDSREDYTKSDWILWVATLTDDAKKREALYQPILRYLSESPSRKPFGDLYYTKSGVIKEFFNRTVQGGIFAPLLRLSDTFEVNR